MASTSPSQASSSKEEDKENNDAIHYDIWQDEQPRPHHVMNLRAPKTAPPGYDKSYNAPPTYDELFIERFERSLDLYLAPRSQSSAPPAKQMDKDTAETANVALDSDSISSTSEASPTLYFAYGSNLSTTQMDERCPTSTLHTSPLAVLKDWEWFIASRGYASIRPTSGNCVYGLLYELDNEAEELLDLYEGVGFEREGSYYKKEVWVDLLPKTVLGSGDEGADGDATKGEDEKNNDMRVKVLVYIDCTDEEGELGNEYACRLKRGVEESAKLGLESGDSFGQWMDQVMDADEAEKRHGSKRRKAQRKGGVQ